MEMDEILELARMVGAVVRENFGNEKAGSVVGRGHGGDQTRVVDKIAEDMILKRAAEVGDVEVLSEETGVVRYGAPNQRWVVDPLDGSTNFSRGIPNFAVSILVERLPDFEPVIGVIFDPMRAQLYNAAPSKGAFMNGKQLKTNSERPLEERVFYLDLHFGRNRAHFDPFIQRYLRLGPHFNTYRSLGSAALALAFTAAGRLDGFLDLSGNSRYLDVAAGNLILEEAGGCVTDLKGTKIREHYDSLIACATVALNERMREILTSGFQEK
jgi:myo-inositol-1(or 4)-monophosphatase